ncbi:MULTISPECIES: hypothetical protein [unclassified Pseudomonas]|jgi:hypothetical protein|uniref:hypothetical protein n=1 Tax=unclassified Pseudomonas TaxID=196821 RepID=UPI000289AC0D|nr:MULTISPECIES: hypothetical protein [unclassified Pseudomonas]MBK5437301.1 hypothetical protein [Pseudomonas sp. TH32]MDF3198861.1 hypothetical protein [Pseudomonas sp. 1912-s]QJI37479.1 hypothetical protein HKK54_24750 [Pseudomonas sp. ADAK13]
MKISTVILAGLMTMTSVAAFAEGGSERSKEFYNNFTFVQEQVHGAAQQTAMADGKTAKPATADQTTNTPNS